MILCEKVYRELHTLFTFVLDFETILFSRFDLLKRLIVVGMFANLIYYTNNI
jgi:hypothetical protein